MSQGDSKKRAAPSSDSLQPRNKKTSITLKQRLEAACAQDDPKGWRALELGFHPHKGRRTPEFRTAFFADLTELEGCRSSRTRDENNKVQRTLHGTFATSKERIDPLSNYYLTYSWGVGKNYAAEMSKTRRITGSVGATLVTKKKQHGHEQAQENTSTGSPVVKDPPVVEQAVQMGSSVAARPITTANTTIGQTRTQPSQQTPQSAQLIPTDDQVIQMAQETRTLFQHAREHKYGKLKGWRARQKQLSAIHCSREFQHESLCDLVVLRACLSDNEVFTVNGPAAIDNIAFAWNVDRRHFQTLFQGKRASANLEFAQALAEALSKTPTTAAAATQETTRETSVSTPLSLVNRLLAQKPKTTRKKPPPKKAPLKDILAAGCALEKSKGWRARELGFPNGKVGRLHEFRNAFSLDLAELRGFNSARAAADSSTAIHTMRASNGKFTKAHKQHDPSTISYLNYAWGVGRNYANSLMNPEPQRERMRQQRKKGKQDEIKARNESTEQNLEAVNQNDMTGEASI